MSIARKLLCTTALALVAGVLILVVASGIQGLGWGAEARICYSSAAEVRPADFETNYFAGTGPGLLPSLALGLLSVLTVRAIVAIVRGRVFVPGGARVLMVSGLIFGLSLLLYAAWDPRSHALLLSPVLTDEWQLDVPELAGGFCPPGRQELPFSVVRLLYPSVDAPDRAFFNSDEVSVGFWGVDVRHGLSRWHGIGVDQETLDATHSGIAFDIIVNKKKPDVMVDLSRLRFLEPCGPGVSSSPAGPKFTIVPERKDFYDPAGNHTQAFLVVDGQRDQISRCTINLREAVRTPSGKQIPNLDFRRVHVTYVRQPGEVIE